MPIIRLARHLLRKSLIMGSPSTHTLPQVLRFGLFEVDVQSNELRKRGVRLKLQDQPLCLLKVLLEQPGVLITRDEFRQRLWKPDTFVEFDHSLNTAMMRLREALGDSSDNPQFIETVPRKGYRFIAPVYDIEREEPAKTARPLGPANATMALDVLPVSSGEALLPVFPDSPTSLHRAEGAGRQISLRRAVSVAAVVLLVLSVAALIEYERGRISVRAVETGEVRSIAVLPMQNLSGDANQDYFADGMTDELIASLARISSLRVISRTTAMEYKGTHQSLEKIARDLHVDAVVEGTVLRSGDRVRITAELIQVSTDRHLWADTYETPLGDILALQTHVASAIVSQIRIKLTPQDREQLTVAHPVNSAAFEDYLKGRYYWGKRSEGSLDKAIHYFQSATDNDPQYALAYAGLADCYGILGAAIVGTVPTSEVAPKAEAAATKALELDPTLAEAQTAAATVEFNYNWNWTAAEAGFRRAIQLTPSNATAHQRYSLYLIAMGRTAESLTEMNQARSLDPLSPRMSFSLGWRFYMARQYDEAIAQLTNSIDMDASYLLAHIVLGQCYEQKGQFTQAIAELQTAASLSPNDPPVTAELAHAYALAGKRSEALKLLENLEAQSLHRYVSPYYPAVVYAGLRQKEQALSSLRAAYNDRSNGMIFLNATPVFDDLRQEPEFKDLLRRMNLPIEGL